MRVLETSTHRLRVQANGGQQPLEVAAANIPEDYLNQTVTLSFRDWEEMGRWLGKYQGGLEIWHKVIDKLFASAPVPDNAKIRAALAQRVPCPECTVLALQPKSAECPRCEGKGTVPRDVPGAKLLPRAQHLRVE